MRKESDIKESSPWREMPDGYLVLYKRNEELQNDENICEYFKKF